MNPEVLNLVLLAGVVLVVGVAGYLVLRLIDSRPDIIALISLIAMSASFLDLTMNRPSEPFTNVLIILVGGFFLILAGFTYNRNRGTS